LIPVSDNRENIAAMVESLHLFDPMHFDLLESTWEFVKLHHVDQNLYHLSITMVSVTSFMVVVLIMALHFSGVSCLEISILVLDMCVFVCCV